MVFPALGRVPGGFSYSVGCASLALAVFGKYTVYVAKRKRLTYTLTADPDVLRRSDAILKHMGVTRSAFFESQMIGLISWAEPMRLLIEAGVNGEIDQGEVKAHLRQRLPDLQEMMATAHGEMASLTRWAVSTEEE